MGDNDGNVPQRATATTLDAALVEAVGSILDRDRFLRRVAAALAAALRQPRVALYTRGAGDTLLLRASSQAQPAYAPAKIALDSADVVEIAATPAHSALVAPLLERDACFGAVVVFSDQGARFSVEDRRRLAAAAERVAPAVAAAEEHHAVRQASVLDTASGARTSWFLHQRLEEEIARAQRGGGSVTVLLVAIVGFDAARAGVSYTEYDRLLHELATGLAAVTRTFDIVSYEGAGVFAVALPESDSGGAGIVVERARAQLRKQIERFTAGARDERGQPVTLALASGVAAYPTDGDRVATLLLAAGHRLDEDRLRQRGVNGTA